MWPLEVDTERCSGYEETTLDREQHRRWLGDAGTAYFDDFKALWTHAHDSRLRELPLMGERDDVVIQSAKARFCQQATAVSHAVLARGNDDNNVLDDEETTLPSFWNRVQPHRRAISEGECDNDKKDLARSAMGQGKTRLEELQDTIRIVDLQDDRKRRSAMASLQEQIQTALESRLSVLPALPECPLIWTGFAGAKCDLQCSLNKVMKPWCMQGRMDLALAPPRMVEPPYHSSRNRLSDATSGLILQSAQLHESIVHSCTRDPVGDDGMSADFPLIFDSMTQKTSLSRRWSLFTPQSKENINAKGPSEHDKRYPKLLKFDGLIRVNICPSTVNLQASAMFKAVVKKNASLLFGGAIPGSDPDEINRFLRRASLTTTKFLGQSNVDAVDGIQLLTLPSEVAQNDGKRVDSAYRCLQEQAQQVCKMINHPTISLTSVSLALPSIWRHPSTLKIVQDLKLRTWALSGGLQTGGDFVEADLLPANHTERAQYGEATFQEDVVGEGVGTPKSLEKVTTEGASSPITKNAESAAPIAAIPSDKENAHSLTAVTPQPLKKVTFKIQEDLSTDELVTSFLGVDISGEFVREDVSSFDPSTCALERIVHPANHDLKLMMIVDQLARPAIWFLGRLKLLKVKCISASDGLRWIHLEVLDAITCQLHAKLKGISSNPSTMQAEEIIETCSAFRHAVWLHILRLIVTSEADSRKSALHVAWRVLESPSYQLSIGVKQTSALAKLYNVMGGSSDRMFERVDFGKQFSEERPLKKPRIEKARPATSPIRVVCDMRLLSREELLDTLSDLQVSVVERELHPVVDLVIDEQNAIVLLGQQHFDGEPQMRTFTYELASSQVQFETLWIIIDDSAKNEDVLHVFFAALPSFVVDVQTFFCNGEAETGEVIRGIIDVCSETALSQHRILPKMWFARPFMLEEESQLERFLSSTRIVSGFAAQSILHRVSVEDITTKSLEEVSNLIGSLPGNQVDLLWRLFHTSHGIGADQQVIA